MLKDGAISAIVWSFSALQRAEIAEILRAWRSARTAHGVSVLFNEPKLLKYDGIAVTGATQIRFSALQRAEIAEIS